MIKIGGASGYWGESAMATPQLLKAGVDVLVYDYLAEITMSLLARARMKDPAKGYATDFVSSAMKPHLRTLAETGTKVISNAGGVNPKACGDAIRQLIDAEGLDLKVAVIEGDDLLGRRADMAELAPTEMFSGAPFPHPMTVVSINAYLGAFPIAEALKAGADIIVTGRAVDSASTLGALIAHFDWKAEDLDLLAAGSMVGHLLECGPQATGGNFTDWRDVPNRAAIGYPIAEVKADGSAIITKPEGSGGLVSRGTVTEQLVYEIGDPSAYILPDVVCDFTQVTINEIGSDRVQVSGARGQPAPDTYKVCATHVAGWRGGITPSFYGFEAGEKAQAFADAAFDRAEAILKAKNLPPYTEESVEILGTGAQLGEADAASEVTLKMAVRHADEAGIAILLKETAGMGLATPPGLCGFAGARPKPTPVVQLFSFLLPKRDLAVTLDLGDRPTPVEVSSATGEASPTEEIFVASPSRGSDLIDVPLIKAAWARSGDKGDSANVGVIARHPDLLHYLWEQLTEDVVRERFEHVLDGDVSRFLMPGPFAINYVLTQSLGGGGIASLRNDPQGKGFSQVMLTLPVRVPRALIEEIAP